MPARLNTWFTSIDYEGSVRLAVVLALAACATEPDRRETASYVITAILEPACGRGGCHSSDTRPKNLAFDTIPDALAAMHTTQRRMPMVVPGSPDKSRLILVLSDTNRVMPPDQPLSAADIDLLTQWIADGADGYQ